MSMTCTADETSNLDIIIALQLYLIQNFGYDLMDITLTEMASLNEKDINKCLLDFVF